MRLVPLTESALRRSSDGKDVAHFAENYDVRVYRRGTDTEVTIWADEEATETLPQPLHTDDRGRVRGPEEVLGWVPAGPYEIEIAGERVPWIAPRPTFDVAYFGAMEDGETDDTAAVQAAADAAEGGILCIPGTCRVTKQLRLPSNIVLDGEGTGKLFFDWIDATGAKSGGSTYVVNDDTSGAAETIALRNLVVEGAGTGDPAGSPEKGVVSGVLARRVKGFKVFGCTFRRIPGIGVAYQGCQRVRILNNEVVEGGRDGITGYWYTDNLTDVVIANNVIREVGDDGIAIQASTAETPNTVARAKDISITGNTIYGASQKYESQAGRGIIVTGAEDVVVAGNAISDTFSTGIAINKDTAGSEFRCRQVAVTGNVVRRAAVWNDGTQPTVGIRLVSTDGCTVSGNTVTEAAGDGIYVSDSIGATISANTVEGCGTALGSFGIHLDGVAGVRNVLDCTVSANVVRNNTGGIRCNYSQKCPVIGNTCVNNGRTGNGTQNNGSGIILTGDTTFIVTGNSCYDTNTEVAARTQTFGVVVTTNSGAIVLTGNYLAGNAGAGISTTGVTPLFLVKRGNIESATAGSALNHDRDVSGSRQYSGTGSPNEVVEAPVGSTFRRTDGGAGSTFYVKETGTGKSGWVAK